MTSNLDTIIEEPMGDDDIKHYFPNAQILKYSELNNFDSIDEVLPNNKSFSFLLYEDSPNKGHWCCISRNDGEYEFFDSYGGRPDAPLNWNDKITNQMLGQGKKTLSQLFDNTDLDVVYNDIKYQEEEPDVNTCGRHCVFRLKKMIEGLNLHEYYNFMKNQKNKTGKTYDEIVSSFISKT